VVVGLMSRPPAYFCFGQNDVFAYLIQSTSFGFYGELVEYLILCAGCLVV